MSVQLFRAPQPLILQLKLDLGRPYLFRAIYSAAPLDRADQKSRGLRYSAPKSVSKGGAIGAGMSTIKGHLRAARTWRTGLPCGSSSCGTCRPRRAPGMFLAKCPGNVCRPRTRRWERSSQICPASLMRFLACSVIMETFKSDAFDCGLMCKH